MSTALVTPSIPLVVDGRKMGAIVPLEVEPLSAVLAVPTSFGSLIRPAR